ncbi:hypothetical protein PENTCL1PPCAC_9579, partial [Pristionchus entomophagus]
DPLSVRDEIFQIIKRTNYRDTDGCNIGTSPFFSNSREVTRIEEGRFRSLMRICQMVRFNWHLLNMYSRPDKSTHIKNENLTEDEIRILRRNATDLVVTIIAHRTASLHAATHLSQRVCQSAFAIFRMEVIPWFVAALQHEAQMDLITNIPSLADLDGVWTDRVYDASLARNLALEMEYPEADLEVMIDFCVKFDERRRRFESDNAVIELREEYELTD